MKCKQIAIKCKQTAEINIKIYQFQRQISNRISLIQGSKGSKTTSYLGSAHFHTIHNDMRQEQQCYCRCCLFHAVKMEPAVSSSHHPKSFCCCLPGVLSNMTEEIGLRRTTMRNQYQHACAPTCSSHYSLVSSRAQHSLLSHHISLQQTQNF